MSSSPQFHALLSWLCFRLWEPVISLLHSQSSWKSRQGFPQIKHITLTLCVMFGSADSKEWRFLSKSDILRYVDINEIILFWGKIIDSLLHAETHVRENDLWNIKLNESHTHTSVLRVAARGHSHTKTTDSLMATQRHDLARLVFTSGT